MKKMLAFMTIMLLSVAAFCQLDSTTVENTVSQVYDSFLGTYISSHAWIVVVITIVAILSEVLAGIDKLESNSVLQLVKNIFVSLLNKTKKK